MFHKITITIKYQWNHSKQVLLAYCQQVQKSKFYEITVQIDITPCGLLVVMV